MRIVKNVTINGREFELQELTVAEIIKVLENLNNPEVAAEASLADRMFENEEFPLIIVAESAGIKRPDLDEMHPSDLNELISEVKAANPHCARLIQVLYQGNPRANK